jgi:hypothetical protein
VNRLLSLSLVFIFFGAAGSLGWKMHNDLQAASVAEGREAIPQAMWVYRTDQLILEKQLGALLAFCQARKINTLYLSLTKNLSDQIQVFGPQLANFIREAQAGNIKVEALFSEPSWLLPDRRHRLIANIKIVQDYNRQVAPDARFTGLHLDLEINQLPDWKNHLQTIGQHLLDTVKLVKATEPSMQVVVDLPVWLERWGISQWCDVMVAADGIVFMAFEQNDPARISKNLQKQLEFCRGHQKRVWIGLRAKDFSTLTSLDSFISQISGSISPLSGIAIFEYEAYQKQQLK